MNPNKYIQVNGQVYKLAEPEDRTALGAEMLKAMVNNLLNVIHMSGIDPEEWLKADEAKRKAMAAEQFEFGSLDERSTQLLRKSVDLNEKLRSLFEDLVKSERK